jgi:hypothetical protein
MWSRKIVRRKRPRPDGPGASADALALFGAHVIEHRRSSTDERAPNHRPILRALSQELLARLSGPTLVPLGWTTTTGQTACSTTAWLTDPSSSSPSPHGPVIRPPAAQHRPTAKPAPRPGVGRPPQTAVPTQAGTAVPAGDGSGLAATLATSVALPSMGPPPPQDFGSAYSGWRVATSWNNSTISGGPVPGRRARLAFRDPALVSGEGSGGRRPAGHCDRLSRVGETTSFAPFSPAVGSGC